MQVTQNWLWGQWHENLGDYYSQKQWLAEVNHQQKPSQKLGLIQVKQLQKQILL